VVSDHWARGGEGALDLGNAVLKTIETQPSQFKTLYPDEMPLWKKGADDCARDLWRRGHHRRSKVRDRFKELQDQGYGTFRSASPKRSTASPRIRI
jgi:formate--tetrahydrofolate ligase